MESFQTGDIWLCSTCQFAYGEDCLVRIEVKQNNYNRDTPTFYLAVAPDEAATLQKDLQDGCLAISDLKSFARTYSFLTRRLREMKKRSETSWVSPQWVRGEVS